MSELNLAEWGHSIAIDVLQLEQVAFMHILACLEGNWLDTGVYQSSGCYNIISAWGVALKYIRLSRGRVADWAE